MLRQAQHERKIFNNFRTNPARPEPVEGRGSIFSPQIKKETYMGARPAVSISGKTKYLYYSFVSLSESIGRTLRFYRSAPFVSIYRRGPVLVPRAARALSRTSVTRCRK